MLRAPHPACERDTEDSPSIDLLCQLFKTGGADERVHLRLRAPAHDPGLSFTIRQCTSDELDLWMPGLACVDQESAGVDRIGKAGQRAPERGVVGEKLVQAGDDRNRRPR